MFIGVRKENDGSIYIDKNIYQRTKEVVNENGEVENVRIFSDEELSLPPYNYKKINVPDDYVEEVCDLDFNDDLTFSNEKYSERIFELSKEKLREKRIPLLKAFDIYKSNVVYGITKESEEQKNAMITWYELLLDLDEKAFKNVPNVINYYL